MANFFKKRGVATSAVQMTDSEAALAQSDYNIEKITDIQNKFTGGLVLVYPGRIFIREGLLWKVCRKGPKKRQFFLFNDILVYGSVVANRYSNQHILPLSQMSVSAECFYQPRVNADFDEDSEQMELDAGNAFQISHANKSFHVFALSSADKANWLANLHKHINKIAQSVSSDNQLVTKPVWVPDSMTKECMTCAVKFTPFIRKHHCRRCGRVVCSTCSPHRMPLTTFTQTSHQSSALDAKKLERICVDCFKDMSSVSNRQEEAQPPQTSVQMVSSTVQSAKAAESVHVEEDQHSSTDTEDSDDSETEEAKETSTPNEASAESFPKEAYAESVPVQNDTTDHTGSPDADNMDSLPTPPPRKKKLKKKLEKIMEAKKYDTEQRPALHDVDTHNKKSNEDEAGSEVHSSGVVPKTVATESPTAEVKSPKRSRRRKKHIQVDDKPDDDKRNDSNLDDENPNDKGPDSKELDVQPDNGVTSVNERLVSQHEDIISGPVDDPSESY